MRHELSGRALIKPSTHGWPPVIPPFLHLKFATKQLTHSQSGRTAVNPFKIKTTVYLFGITLALFAQHCFADPSAPDITKVPQPFLEEHQGLVDLYKRAFEIAFTKIHKGTPQNGFVEYYIDEGFNPNIFQWDTIFMMMFARYSNGELPSVVSLENFYRKQDADGWICREIRESDGTGFWPKTGSVPGLPDWNSNCSINPPLFSWAEWENFIVTGDKTRFTKDINGKTILQRLVDYFYWVKNNRQWDNQLYWTTSWANGMDDNPRLNPNNDLKVCDNAGGSWIDITTQQAMNAFYIAQIAQVVGNDSISTVFQKEYTDIKNLVNSKMWDNQDGFYYDLDNSGNFFKVKSPASFWPMIAHVTSDQQEQRIIEHIVNPEEFWTPHHIPTVAKNEPGFRSDGGYWRGAVWAPTTYQTINGLKTQGYTDLASKIALNHLENLYFVYKTTNSLHENYQPLEPKVGIQAQSNFVGWTGCGPIACLIENVLGIQVHGPNDTLDWDINLAERHGINNLQFGDNTISLLCEDRLTSDAGAAVTITTNSPFKLHATVGKNEYIQDVPKGTSKFSFGNVENGLSTISMVHSGTESSSFGSSNDEVMRYQTFTADTNQCLRGVDLKIRQFNGSTQSDVTVDLYATQSTKPTGTALASAVIKAGDIDNFYCNVHADLEYSNLKAGTMYAIVLGQKTKQSSNYQWVNGVEVDAKQTAGKGDGNGNWTIEIQQKNCWMKIYTRKDKPVKINSAQFTTEYSNIALDIRQVSNNQIRYCVPGTLGENHYVTVRLIDLSGRQLAILNKKQQQAGIYVFDIRDFQKNRSCCNSGFYFCTISSGKLSKTCHVMIR